MCFALCAAACTFGADPVPRARADRTAQAPAPRPSDEAPVFVVAAVEVSMPAPAPAMETAVRQAMPARADHAVTVGKNAVHAIDPTLERAFASQSSDPSLAWVRSSDRDVIDHLLLGRADFGLISGQLSPREQNAGLRQARVGVELFALVVAANSPVRSLTRSQVRLVLTGGATEWRQLGLTGGAIVTIAPADPLEADRAARTLIPGDTFASTTLRAPSPRHTADQILQNPGAIGVVRLTSAPLEAGQKLVQIDWFSPSFAAFDYGTYPFGQALQVVTSGQPSGLSENFLAFARTEAGRKLLGRTLLLP
ncbi:MAG: substrate-binding domain-containing protein [Planctomycetota bacterium]